MRRIYHDRVGSWREDGTDYTPRVTEDGTPAPDKSDERKTLEEKAARIVASDIDVTEKSDVYLAERIRLHEEGRKGDRGRRDRIEGTRDGYAATYGRRPRTDAQKAARRYADALEDGWRDTRPARPEPEPPPRRRPRRDSVHAARRDTADARSGWLKRNSNAWRGER